MLKEGPDAYPRIDVDESRMAVSYLPVSSSHALVMLQAVCILMLLDPSEKPRSQKWLTRMD